MFPQCRSTPCPLFLQEVYILPLSMRMVPAFQQSKFWKAAIPEFQAIFQASGSLVKSTDERQMKNMMKNIIIFEKKACKMSAPSIY